MNKDQMKTYIYELMTGTLNLEECNDELSKVVANEMAEGSECAKIAEEMYDLRMKIEDKLTEEESKELKTEMLGEYFYDYAQKLAYKMFEYGYLAGEGPLKIDAEQFLHQGDEYFCSIMLQQERRRRSCF